MWKGRGKVPRLCLAVVIGVALVGAACGGTRAGGEGVASVDQGKGAASEGGDQSDGQRAKEPDKAMLDFARCMREHGIDMPDPQPGKGGVMRFEAPPGGGELPDESKFMEADKACRHLMGDAGPQKLSPKDQKEVQDAMLAFARCMREHGIDMPDPQPGGGMVMDAQGRNAPDPRSPEFQSAEKDCRRHTEAVDKKLGVTRSEQ